MTSLLSGRSRAGRGDTRASAVPPVSGLLPLVVVLGLWQLFGADDSVYAPKPSRWLDQVRGLWTGGEFQQALLDTLATFALAFVLAGVLGTVIGTVIGRSRRTDRVLGPVLEFFRVMPAAAIVPLAVLIAGYTENMKVGVVVFSAIWPVLLRVRAGARGLDPLLDDVARSLHLSRPDRWRKVLLPALLPAILHGLRLATSPVLIIVLLVEIVTRINGLGGLIEESQQNFDSAAVYGLLVATGLVALGMNLLVAVVEGRLLRHRPR